jgi:hypothetical protein
MSTILGKMQIPIPKKQILKNTLHKDQEALCYFPEPYEVPLVGPFPAAAEAEPVLAEEIHLDKQKALMLS